MNTGSSSKFSVAPLVRDHYRTLRNYQTGRTSITDLLSYLGIPTASAAASWGVGLHAENVDDVLTAIAIFTGLIFNVFVLIFDLTARAVDTCDPLRRREVEALADQLRANVSYAVLLGLLLSAVLGAAVMVTTSKQLPVPMTAFIVFGSIQLLLTISMILKRVRSMFIALHLARREEIP